jgi:hypothetical protein
MRAETFTHSTHSHATAGQYARIVAAQLAAEVRFMTGRTALVGNTGGYRRTSHTGPA